jgi:phosphate starvation-inducible PhoH-like protein
MARSSKAAERLALRNERRAARYTALVTETPRPDRVPPPIKPKTENQASLIDSLQNAQQVFILGPAGTGKTFLAATHAADRLLKRQIDQIVLTRPNVEAGRPIGFRPGTMEEKMAEWFAEVLAVLRKRMGTGAFDCAVKDKKIEMVPFETMRGRSWNSAVILLDEAQNTTIHEMKMFLTRQGEGSQVIVNGDTTQDDLGGDSNGLDWACDMVEKYNMDAHIIEFDLEDIVRSGPCAEWVKAIYKEGTW